MGRIEELQNIIREALQDIEAIQMACSHPTPCIKKVANASTGNPYERDEYWYECHCSLCDKRWTEEQ